MVYNIPYLNNKIDNIWTLIWKHDMELEVISQKIILTLIDPLKQHSSSKSYPFMIKLL